MSIASTVQDPQGLHFLIAAKHVEALELHELTSTVELVRAASSLVHHLQLERGLSNLRLTSDGPRVDAERQDQLRRTDSAQASVNLHLQRLDPLFEAGTPTRQGSRLYARVAHALQAQSAIAALRSAVEARELPADRVIQAYSRIVSAWLSVVFEAADLAVDPDISRQLVSLFNLMQGKEHAGLERAAGSALFAGGGLQPDDRMKLQDLVDAQKRCETVFDHFAAEAVQKAWVSARVQASWRERERLRRLLLTPSEHGVLSPAMSMIWFDTCTRCIDALKSIEDLTLSELQRLCITKSQALEREVIGLQQLSRAPVTPAQQLTSAQALTMLGGTTPHTMPTLPNQVGQYVAALVQSQAHRLAAVTAELDAARSALQERKLLERAKAILMAQASIPEEEAYHAIRRMAMNQGRRVSEVAESLLRRTI